MAREQQSASPSVERPPSRGNETTWWQGRYGFAAFFLASLLGLWLLLRLALFLEFGRENPVPGGDVAMAFAAGAWRDLYVGLLHCLPLLSWFWIVGNRVFAHWWHRGLFLTGFFLFWMVEVFLLAAEFYFFDEFLSRFNTVAVDYLLYPHEVFINIWDSYPVASVIAGCAVLSGAWVFVAAKLFRGIWSRSVSMGRRVLAFAAVLAVCAAMSLTISLKGSRFSKERVINEIANNGALSFMAAAWTHHLDYAAFYKTIGVNEAYLRVRKMIHEPGSEFVETGASVRRRVAGDANKPKLNVVILLEESLGSEFWGCLGRKGPTLTPEMDKLANDEGLLFTQIYATGNRTVRGFEGVLSSFPPLPGDSIVKRDQSENVETLARVLKRDGYDTVFLYGGRGVFDGMRSYAVNNGYDRFIEQKHFAEPTFATIWGVCDEDLMTRAVEEFREMAKTGKPFFGTVLSVSNHKPYTYPKGRIPEDPDERKRDNAVKYSDYALGLFFKLARKEAFWTNTIFVVVADHGARVYGSQSIPIHSYEVPLLLAGPAVVKAPARVPHLGGLMDVSPTILGLIGRPYETMFLGRDLLKPSPQPGRAFLHHNRDIGMYAKERMVVLGLRHTVEFYAGDPKKTESKLMREPGAAELELEQDCIAMFQVADDLYIHRKFKIDPR